jgi:cell division septum initiation protein DivIVA
VNAEIETTLGKVRATVEAARSMPMSSSVVVNRAELLELLDRLQAAIESGFSQAQEVLGDREAVVASGQAEAQEIVRNAHAEREKLVSDTDVYRLAQERAEEIRAEAEREATGLREEADEYVEAKLANFELTLERTLEAVKRGRARLTGGHVHGLADDSDVADIVLPEHLRR